MIRAGGRLSVQESINETCGFRCWLGLLQKSGFQDEFYYSQLVFLIELKLFYDEIRIKRLICLIGKKSRNCETRKWIYKDRLNLTNPPYLLDKQARNNSELSLQNLDLNLELTDSKIRIIFTLSIFDSTTVIIVSWKLIWKYRIWNLELSRTIIPHFSIVEFSTELLRIVNSGQPNEEEHDTLNDGKRKRNSVQRHVLSRVQEHLLKSLFSMPRTNKDPPRFLLHLRSSARSLWTYTYTYIFSYSLKRNSSHFSYPMRTIDFKLLFV